MTGRWRLAARIAITVVTLCSVRAPARADRAAEERVSGCTDTAGTGKDAPKLSSQVAKRATSGHALELAVSVTHGRGERVLPAGMKLDPTSDAARELHAAGFALADPDGPAASRLGDPTPTDATHAKTKLVLVLVPLNDAPGTQRRHLPAIPVAVARASGRVVTLCTEPAEIEVEDPTASTPEALPRRGPEPLPQREEWTALKLGLAWLASALVLAAILAWIWRWMKRRPKPVPPPPPPRPPWELALESFAAIRSANLIGAQKTDEHVDRVSDTVREYLGARYGFDGLESTTAEIRSRLARVGSHDLPDDVRRAALELLTRADLIKFARATASPDEAAEFLDQGERFVHTTIPKEHPPANHGPTEGAPR